jgi:hypothetical protein
VARRDHVGREAGGLAAGAAEGGEGRVESRDGGAGWSHQRASRNRRARHEAAVEGCVALGPVTADAAHTSLLRVFYPAVAVGR